MHTAHNITYSAKTAPHKYQSEVISVNTITLHVKNYIYSIIIYIFN